MIVDFFCLDTPAMKILFEQTRNEGKVPYRSFQFFQSEVPSHNCRNLIFNLLKQGGFANLLNTKTKTMLLPTTCSFLTLFMVIEALHGAKQHELQCFPEANAMKVLK